MSIEPGNQGALVVAIKGGGIGRFVVGEDDGGLLGGFGFGEFFFDESKFLLVPEGLSGRTNDLEGISGQKGTEWISEGN